MTWDDQNDVLDFWHYYQNINDLMTGIQLDNENWFAGEPQVQNDKSVEMFYLRKGELGENTKMVGAVSNRTYNYYTQGDTLPCTYLPDEGELTDNPIYQVATDFEYDDLNANKLKIKDLGYYKMFKIDWYNALDGSPFGTTILTSNALGVGHIEFPGLLTGSATSPILFFKLYPYGDTFLSPVTSNEFEAALPQEFQLGEDLDPIEPTPWVDLSSSLDLFISISPNPTLGVVNCQVNGDYIGLNLILTNSNGQYLAENKIPFPNFALDLSVYANGSYLLLVQDKEGILIQTIKLVKL